MVNLIGQSLGRYHILEQLGEGGMAVVYKAYDMRLETEVAVKVIRTENLTLGTMDRALKRFEREAKALARLTHPNIVKVLDYGEYEGKPYLVMPYLPGGTLKARLGKPIPWRDAALILSPIADALEYAHEHGIIHRDVKPANILITEKGQPMLSDFGVAKLLDTEITMELTGTGVGLGTPEYMAPEQVISRNVDHRADIYALGIVLYEMITGRKPYIADTPMAVMIMHSRDPLPNPKKYISDLPEGMEKVLLKALAKDPADRYQNMREMVKALERIQTGMDGSKGVVRDAAIKTETLSNFKIRKWVITSVVFAAILGVILLSVFNHVPGTTMKATSTRLIETISPTPIIEDPTAFITPTNIPTTEPAPLPAKITDKQGIQMVLVPGGEFSMGSEQYENEKPVHQVHLESYYIDQYEVTNAAYKTCVDSGVCASPQKAESAAQSEYFGNEKFDNYPVVYVDWSMAMTYCQWRSALLPTEAVWEKAAHGAEIPPRIYPWGDVIDETLANYNQNIGDTTAIGKYENGKSIYGAYDMAGNVWEWVSSLYMSYPYTATDGREDLNATGPRVLRGGSWINIDKNLRTTSRQRGGSTNTSSYMGFRCYKVP